MTTLMKDMTLHDYYVGLMMQGICANEYFSQKSSGIEQIKYAREMADEMLKQREQSTKG